VWSALSAEPRAAFCYVVTVPLDLEITSEEPFVFGRTFGFRSLTHDGGPESRTTIRGTVRDVAGAPLENVTVATLAEPIVGTATDSTGAYALRTPESGKVGVRVTHPDGWSRTMELDLDVKPPSFDLVLRS
jgi:protocatechuate 3,4-dioxygenase beta subunit